MPKYEYACKDCGEHLEVVQSFSDDPLTACPTCGGPLRKVFGNIGVVFKGSGFYKNDSRTQSKSAAANGSKDKADKADKSDKSGSSGDTKSSGSSGSSGDTKSSGSSGSSGDSKSDSSSGSKSSEKSSSSQSDKGLSSRRDGSGNSAAKAAAKSA